MFIEGNAVLQETAQKILAESGAEYVISSRMDNDDCLGRQYTTLVQNEFSHQNNTVVDVLDGFMLQVSPKLRLGKKMQPFNPFVSLIEKNDSPRSIWARAHGHWKHEHDVITVRGGYPWTTIIHHGNVANHFDAFGTVDQNAFKHHFVFDETVREQLNSPLKVTFGEKIQSFFHGLNEYFKLYTKALKRKIRLSLKKR